MVSAYQPLINLKIVVLVISLSTFANRTKRNLKYILLWNLHELPPFTQLGTGHNAFIENKCPQVDCYVTNDRTFFNGDLKNFDAIAFNARNISKEDLPSSRSDHQKYIFVSIESAYNYPVCESVFDNYFNWTYTYKLNSDILNRFVEIRNKNDEVVGPKPNMKWIQTNIDTETLNAVKVRWQRRSEAVAWVVSNCHSLNGREKLAKKIKESLNSAKLSHATYGSCGERSCELADCWNFIEWNFHFYLAFENSNCEDYVTEKLLYPLQHYVIPIVYGGANYSRFLPPGSYLDASKLSPSALVAEMKKIISSLNEYLKFFKWRSMYKYTDPERNNVCALCLALHHKQMIRNRKSYKKFRKWWFLEYEQFCAIRRSNEVEEQE